MVLFGLLVGALRRAPITGFKRLQTKDKTHQTYGRDTQAGRHLHPPLAPGCPFSVSFQNVVVIHDWTVKADWAPGPRCSSMSTVSRAVPVCSLSPLPVSPSVALLDLSLVSKLLARPTRNRSGRGRGRGHGEKTVNTFPDRDLLVFWSSQRRAGMLVSSTCPSDWTIRWIR